jgi:hypothetical protein
LPDLLHVPHRETPEQLMTTITTMIHDACQADPLCGRALYFQARLEGHKDGKPVIKTVRVCAAHLGDTVQVLATWARENSVTCQKMTVLVIDPLPCGIPARGSATWGGFEFGSILLAG